jgi:AcrR family transcriptional regulator
VVSEISVCNLTVMPTGWTPNATFGSGNRVGSTPTSVRRGRPLSPELDDRILEAALAMLADVGYARLRLDALAARAGVAKTTILRRWPSKAAVAAAAVQRLALQTADVPESSNLREDLQALLSNAVAAFASGPGRFVPALIRESGHHAEIADLLATVIQARRAAYRRVLNRAIARHDLLPDVDQEVIIDLLVGPLWTRLLITREPVTQALVEEIVDAVLRAYPPAGPTGATATG